MNKVMIKPDLIFVESLISKSLPRFYRLVMLATVLVCFVQHGSANDWPQFRGPGGNASAEMTRTPIRWDDQHNLAWKAKLPGRGASSPIIVGDRAYITAYSGYGIDPDDFGNKDDLRLHVIALDKKSGTRIWEKTLVASVKTQNCTRRVIDHGYATSTPVSDGDAVFAYFGVSGLYAFSKEGKPIWHANTGEKTAGFGSASSPVIHKNLVIVNASIESQNVVAFDKTSGKKVWEIPDVKRSWCTPCLARSRAGKTELIINQIDTVRGFDPLSGRVLWTCQGIPDYTVPVPISQDGVVYCLGGRSNRALAIQLGGSGDVTRSHKLWDLPKGANVTSPVYVDGRLYWASDKGIMNCIDAETGKEIYKSRLPTKKRIYGSIVRGGDHLYVTTRDQGVVVLSISQEYKVVSQNRFSADDSKLNAGPAVSEGSLYIRSDGFLYRITESNR